ncbi:MAG: autoinducer binding domain-containing protein [Pseudomonadota bacterium]|jgi:hypothetical protein|nr:autoinducer binding domain-containing protein [Alphaproteobacteria bacterium]
MKKQVLFHKKHELVDSLLSTIHIDGICYASIGVIKNDVIYSAFSHNKWQQYYIDNELHINDPSFQAAIKIPELPIFWDSVALYTDAEVKVMQKRREAVGARGGVTLCFNSLDKQLLLTIGTSKESTMVSTITKALSSLSLPEVLCSQLSSI